MHLGRQQGWRREGDNLYPDPNIALPFLPPPLQSIKTKENFISTSTNLFFTSAFSFFGSPKLIDSEGNDLDIRKCAILSYIRSWIRIDHNKTRNVFNCEQKWPPWLEQFFMQTSPHITSLTGQKAELGI